MSDLAASIVDGKLVSNTTKDEKKTTGNGSMDKDAFLQLLVAQMKYQDPLEPTSNTEYISQFATFSQLEEMQNMTNAMDMQRASGLIGKYVTMNVKNETTGVTESISGRVDYVKTESGKTLLYINDQPYNIDGLATVWDEDYLEAYNLAGTWATALNALPAATDVTLDYEDSVTKLREAYDKMTDYQKSFISTTLTDKLKAIEEKLAELKAAKEETPKEETPKEETPKDETPEEEEPVDKAEDLKET